MFDITKLPSKTAYLEASPFPHAVIREGFNEEFLFAVEKEVSEIKKWGGESAHQFAQRKRWCNDRDALGKSTVDLIDFLNGPIFLPALEELTGIRGLIPDPYLDGGGVHYIETGGYLGIHADFNYHQRLRVHRRINLIIYLNSSWRGDWGGNLELWDYSSRQLVVEIPPEMNALVVFSTTDRSLHGHPAPLACPKGRARSSIALYYYSAERPPEEMSAPHSTNYYRLSK
jgi:Rps23 Pro-64 3,4-dihydroxylase Tpa1-like proline 4-hydroxylase